MVPGISSFSPQQLRSHANWLFTLANMVADYQFANLLRRHAWEVQAEATSREAESGTPVRAPTTKEADNAQKPATDRG